MTATVQPESKAPSRRALLAGALGGLGALAASAIGRSSAVRAATGDPVLVDGTHTGSGTTSINTTGPSAFYGYSSNGNADAIFGWAAAATGAAWGVRGETSSSGGRGVVGLAGAASGVTIGVSGETDSTSGRAVHGIAHSITGTTYGVWAQSDSPSGVGMYAVNDAGLALQTAGRAKFSTSGVATITAGSTSKTVTPGVNVTSGSFVLLTPKVKLSGRDLWFTTDAAGNKFTIHMSSSRSSGTKVAWLLLG
jgi:hypothetical protein